ncbi:MAG TPA: PQQ-binding-like beta-propeller repeat protein, partial [Isosphaeraceae bacterium]|nr:PQQ-binding-like beta-propeller repeat protein [Isosphaeraceae bacterium]
MRSLSLALWLLPTLALAQDPQPEIPDGKVSNDDPARPLQMPPASTEAKEAIDDFDRFQRRKAWERALKAIDAIPADQASRFIDGKDGFIIPLARKRHDLLSALPPEGQSAVRLFHDAEAKKLLDEAEGAAELPNLEKLFSAYFITTVGDNAADRLGDLYFEMGRFDRAADCWLAVLRERPDTDLSPALLTVKAALALTRAGRREEAEALRRDLADRFADERVTLGGQTARAAELFRRLAGSTADESPARPTAAPQTIAPPDLSRPVEVAWQVKIAATVEAGMSPPELTQWEANPVSSAVPAVAASGSRLFVNYLGHDLAVDLDSGKMLWRSGSFHHLKLTAMQNQGRMIEPERFAVLAEGDLVWFLGRDMKDQNMMAPFALTCRRADGGEVVWKSNDLGDYAGLDLAGDPILADGKLFVAAKMVGNNPMVMHTMGQPQQQGGPRVMVLAIRPHDGKILWKTDVAHFRQNNPYRFFYYNMTPDVQPKLAYRAGAVYVDTHQGILARLDADSGALDWGFGYQTDAAQGGQRFVIFWGEPMQQSRESTSGAPVAVGESFLVKGAQSGKLYAVDPNRMAVRWERPIAKS